MGSGADPVATPLNLTGCNAGHYVASEVITVTASPAPAWSVSGWSGTDDDLSTEVENTVTMPPADHTVTVHYAPACYTLTLTHTGNGGDPVASPPGSEGCSPGEYLANAIITVTAAPATGWLVEGWSGTDDDRSTTLQNTVTMPAGNHIVTDHYVEDINYLSLPIMVR